MRGERRAMQRRQRLHDWRHLQRRGLHRRSCARLRRRQRVHQRFLQPCFGFLGYRPGSLPVSEAATAEAISLPVYPELTAGQQDAVVNAVRDFYT